MKPPQMRLALLGLALGVLLALLLAPQTRWLVRLQALTALRLYHPLPGENAPSYTRSEADDARDMQAVVTKHPDDFGLRYAQAIDGGGNPLGSPQAVTALRGLESRFPDRPALYANVLRYAAGGLHWNRMEEDALYSASIHPPGYRVIPTPPEALAAFDRDAAAGERLDPNNAYFPIMRAVGLFMTRRDSEGLAAVMRAERETQWREYVPEEVEARWRLHEAAFGDPSALPRTFTAYLTLFPQYTLQRALARLLLYKVVQAERAGHDQEGFQLREALRHYGDLMRVQSTSLIGSLVGIAITAIATADPGGVIPPKDQPRLTPDQMAQRRLDAYCAYVTRIGHPEAAAKAEAEEDARQKVQAVAGLDQLRDLTTSLVRLAAWWLAGLATLANILWLLVFSGLAAGLARTRWYQKRSGGPPARPNKTPILGSRRERAKEEGEASSAPTGIPSPNPAPPGLGVGGGSRRQEAFAKRIAVIAMSAAVVFLLADFSLHLFNLPNWLSSILHGVEELLFLLAVFGLPSALAVYLMRHGPHVPRFSRPPSLRGIRAALLGGVCLYGLYALFWWQAGSLADFAGGPFPFIQDGSHTDALNAQTWMHWLSLAAALALPLLLALVLGIAACVRHVPVTVGLVRGFQSAALPAACVLLLVYGGLLLGTARQERVVNDQVWHSAHDEGPYLAAQAGQSWPGPIN